MSVEFLKRMFGLDGQIAVVIGGTGTLGGAIAEGLGQAGATVVVAGRSEARGYKRVDVIRALGATSGFMYVDATSRESMNKLLDRVLGEYGRADMLVNCAGGSSATPYDKIDDADWQAVIDSVLTATQLGCQAFAPTMAKQDEGGSILNIGSVAAHLPLSRVYAYSAAKAAVVSLTKNVAREYATRGVRVNVLCPGYFPTEANSRILDEERTANVMRQTPMKRFGEPRELIGPALMLLSRRAGSFTTGAELYVDGGFTAMKI